MGWCYEKVYLSYAKIDSQNRGLMRILIIIGQNEFAKKYHRAIKENRRSFFFPSGRRRERIKCLVDACLIDTLQQIPEKFYYREGVECINRRARMGKMNKGPLNKLVMGNTETVNKEDGKHYVYYIHKWKSARIFSAIRQYICKEFSARRRNFLGYDNSKELLKYVRYYEKEFFGTAKVIGEKIIAKPYIEELQNANFLFCDRIVDAVEAYNRITGREGV